MVTLIYCFGCIKNPTDNSIEKIIINIKEDCSESEFKETAYGKWVMAFEYKDEENVEYLELTRKGKALIVIKKGGDRKTFGGNFSLNLLYPPEEGWVTIATLTIESSRGSVKLHDVHFYYHAGALGINLLSITDAPYAVMKKIDF